MGRYPFLVQARIVLRETKPDYADITFRERARKLRRISHILDDMWRQNLISSRSPFKMTERDVRDFISYGKKTLKLDNSTLNKYLRYLDEVLISVGNASVVRAKKNLKRKYPVSGDKEIFALNTNEMERLLAFGYSLEDDWWDATGKAAIALGLHTGIRSGELRLTKLADLDLARMKLRVSAPKGQGRWASGKEEVDLMPGCEGVLRDFLDIRAEKIMSRGLDPCEIEPLFPYTDDKRVGYWLEAIFCRLKVEIEKVSGVRFRWKDLRPSLAQKLIDDGSPIEAVSKQLRHSSTRTTEEYYARIRSEKASSLNKQAWKPLLVGNSMEA